MKVLFRKTFIFIIRTDQSRHYHCEGHIGAPEVILNVQRLEEAVKGVLGGGRHTQVHTRYPANE